MPRLTLKQQAELARNQVFRDRLIQALFNKADYFFKLRGDLSSRDEIKKAFAINFLRNISSQVDTYSIARIWLINYTTENPVLDQDGQPVDSELLNSNATDIVFNILSGLD